MENTTPLLFDDTEPKYFVATQGKAMGPLTSQEVYERVAAGEVGLLHFCWRAGWSDWKRLCDDKEFAILIPQKPPTAAIGKLRDKARPERDRKSRDIYKDAVAPSSSTPKVGEAPRKFYLYYNKTQYGPFSRPELVHALETHTLGRNAYLWIPGWSNWKRVADVEEFARYVKIRSKTGTTKRKLQKPGAAADATIGARVSREAGVDASEKRGGPRRPLVARLFVHNDRDVIIAVCRDISVGGMQVLTDRVPGPAGTTVKLNVSPGDPNRVEGFVAEGEIVRVLEDGRGFSFRFTRISDEARSAIERYISE